MKRLFSMLLILLLLCSCHKTADTAISLEEKEKQEQITLSEPEPEPEPELPPQSVILPVLMYHDFRVGECEPNGYTVSVKSFDAQLAALKDAGYSAVNPTELYEYLRGEAKSFPEKPILITFDDGYQSNLDIAVPILKKHGMKATVFVVGNMMGKKDAGMIPRFSIDEAVPYVKDGVIDIQSHTHALHDMQSDRQGVLMKNGEDIYEYKRMLIADIVRSKTDIRKGTGKDIIAISYPFGFYNEHSISVFAAQKIPLQFTSDYGVNKIEFNSLENHRLFNRISIGDEITGKQLINMITATE